MNAFRVANAQGSPRRRDAFANTRDERATRNTHPDWAAYLAAVALGPGSIAQAHTKDEWIAVGDLERGVEFFRQFLGAL